MLRSEDSLSEHFHIGRTLLILVLASCFRCVRGKPALERIIADLKCFPLRIPFSKCWPLQRFGYPLRVLGVGRQLLPIFEVTISKFLIVNDERIIGLRAEAIRRPVCRSQQDGFWPAFVGVNEELVMPNVVIRHDTVDLSLCRFCESIAGVFVPSTFFFFPPTFFITTE